MMLVILRTLIWFLLSKLFRFCIVLGFHSGVMFLKQIGKFL